jgi:hypothetical protein
METKKQYKRLATSASALAGIAAGIPIIDITGIDMIHSYQELWTGLAICAATGGAAGIAGNRIYKAIAKRMSKK